MIDYTITFLIIGIVTILITNISIINIVDSI